MTAAAAAASAAFPTVAASAAPAQKSFFEDLPSGSVITGAVSYGIYPVGEKRGKARAGFVVVQRELLELHKSAKDWRAKKQARHYLRFADVFNMCVQLEPVQLKGDCLALMEPADTYLIRPVDSEYPVEAWLDWLLERARECRSSKLARPVFREEYFEAAWDVLVLAKPKFKKPPPESNTQTEDLAAKRPEMEGRRRLCICSTATSFLLFRMEAKPTFSVDVPFSKGDFVDLPMNVVSNYGCQERYFFVRVGRCSEIGSGELWMQCESGAAAKAMHERISSINLRESDRRRLAGIKINNSFPTISSRMLKSRAHRERSQQQAAGAAAQNAASSAIAGPDAATNSAVEVNSEVNNSAAKDAIEKHKNTSEHRASNASISSRTVTISTLSDRKSVGGLVVGAGGRQSEPTSESRKSTISGLLPFRLNRSSIASVSSAHGLSTARPSTPQSPSCSSVGRQLAVGTTPQQKCDDSPSDSAFAGFAEDYMDYTCDTTTAANSRHNTQSGSGVSGALKETRDRAAAASAALHQPSRQHSLASVGETVLSDAAGGDYARMHAGGLEHLITNKGSGGGNRSIEAPPPTFPLEATRSYVVGSAETSPSSAYGGGSVLSTCVVDSSPGNTTSSRAYSLGAKSAAKAALRKHNQAKRSAHSPLLASPLLTAKSDEGEKSADNAPSQPDESESTQSPSHVLSSVDAEGRSTVDDLEEMRKRAHSLGSKSWGKHSRKPSAKHRAHQQATVFVDGADSSTLARSRIGSTGSGGSHHQGGSRRRNTNRSLASATSSAADPGGHPQSDQIDFHQIDFDGGSCASIDSPMNRSRQSSVGVQLPISMRAALDSLAGTHSARHSLGHHGPPSTSSSFSRPHTILTESGCEMPERKRSVPEIATIAAGEFVEGVAGDQQQRRRSTFDTSTASTLSPVMAKILESGTRFRKRHEHVVGGEEGVDAETRIDESSLVLEEEPDDYIMMVHNPTMPPQRVISTIVESASSSPSPSDSEHCERDCKERTVNSVKIEVGESADYGFITGALLREQQLTPPQRRNQRMTRTKKTKEKSRGNSSSRSSRADPAEISNDDQPRDTDYAELATPDSHRN